MRENIFNSERKRIELRCRLRMRMSSMWGWIVRNKEVILTLTPIMIGGVTTVCKVVGRRRNLRKEQDLKDLYCYDRSLGHYWRLKRELSNKEWLEIDQRKKNGERLSDILAELKVLK